MDKLIKIKRSDGSIDKVTHRELDALNQGKHLKKQLHSMVIQRNRLVLVLTSSWLLFVTFALTYTPNNDPVINPPVAEPAPTANVSAQKDDRLPVTTREKDETTSHAVSSSTDNPAQIPEKTVAVVAHDEQPESTQEITVPALPFDQAEVIAAIKDWSQAWSDQNYGNYISAYSNDFQPDNRYPDYDAWAAVRKKKIESPDWIEVSVSNIEIIEPDTTGNTMARFRQSYNSKNYQDVALKQLIIGHENDSWLILKESSIQ